MSKKERKYEKMKRRQIFAMALATAIMSTAAPINYLDLGNTAILSEAASVPSLSQKQMTVKPNDILKLKVKPNGTKILSTKWDYKKVGTLDDKETNMIYVCATKKGTHNITCTVKYKVGKKVKQKKLVCTVKVLQENEAELVIKNNVVIQCKNSNAATVANIPEGVTRIEETVFYGSSNLKKVTLPSSLKSIGEWAFKSCEKLEEIELPSNVEKIEEDAFAGCYKLSKVTLSDHLKEIGGWAFYNCKIKSITLPESLETIGNKAFGGCDLENVNLPDNLKFIGEEAFNNWDMKELKLPSGIEYIGNRAFARASLKELAIPASLAFIGEKAFGYSHGWFELQVDENNPVYRCENNCIIERKTDALVAIGYCKELPKSIKRIKACSLDGYRVENHLFEVPEGIEELDDRAFEDMFLYKSEIVLPASLKKITGNPVCEQSDITLKVADGNNKFTVVENTLMEKETGKVICAYNKQTTIPSSAKSLGENSFKYVKLRSVNIPAACVKIEKNAFDNENLETITVEKGNPVFEVINKGKTLVDTSCKKIVIALYGTKIGNDIEIIGEGAFCGYDDFGGEDPISLPASVRIIEDSGFDGAGLSFGKKFLGENVTYIGERAFYGSSYYYDAIVIPASVTYIGKDAFGNRDIKVQWNGVTYMNLKAFYSAFYKVHPLEED